MKKLLSLALTMLLSLTVFPQASIKVLAEEKTSTGYEIYPTPHNISYQKGDYILDTEVNVVFEEGIDDFTIDRLEETLALKNIRAQYSDTIDKSKTNILLGVYDSGETVDHYFKEKYTYEHTDLFDHIDSSYLKSDNGTITVIGKDTDSVFYAITTLYHILNQMDSNTISNFTIEDHADVLSRGFIEGYYGEPWSTEDRVDLMEFGGYYKLNSYFYAPKDDPKHNAKWRELYTPEELNDMRLLAEAGNKSKTRFVYALHPYMSNVVRHGNEEHYQEDLGIIKAKFTQMLDIGVRQFSVLGDDAGVPGNDPTNYTRLMVDLTAWLTEMQSKYEGLKTVIPFVPNDYMGDGSSNQLQTIKDMPENIQIVMTGGKVWGEVSTEFTDKFTKNMDRGPYMWINWPCTDNSKKHLIMGGGHVFLEPNVDPNSIEGIVLNPMQQSEPSKLAIFINAAYSWNIWDSYEQADQAWEDAFSYIDHNSSIDTPASLAYKELSKHMINQDMDGRVKVLQESVDLKPILNDFKNKFMNDSVKQEDVAKVRAEFEILANAAKVYRENPGNERTRDQITPWLNSWDDTTSAALHLLDAVSALLNEDESSLIDSFSKGQTAFANSKTHGFSYIDVIEYAEVGVQHIVPFIKTLESNLLEAVENASGITTSEITFYTNISSQPREGSVAGGRYQSSIKNVMDGDADTVAYWEGQVIREGSYVGIHFGTEGKLLHDFQFLLGLEGFANDTIHEGRVQYTVDGKEWVTISTFSNKPVEITHTFDEPVHVRAIRVISDSATSNWFGIRDLDYNLDEEKPETPEEGFNYSFIQSDDWKFFQGNADALFDGNPATSVWFNPNNIGDSEQKDYALVDQWFGMDLGRNVDIDKINLIMGNEPSKGDKLVKYAIETSEDNKDWKTVKTVTGAASGRDNIEVEMDGEKAQYIRVRNLELQKTWVQVTDFTVTEMRYNSKDNVYSNVEDSDIYSNYGDGYVELHEGTALLESGDYYGVDLGSIEKVESANFDFIGDNLTLEYSVNGIEWNTTTTEAVGYKARYIRLINNNADSTLLEMKSVQINYEYIKPYGLHSTTIAQNGNGIDMRNAHNSRNIFDNKLTSNAVFSSVQKQGDYAIFDMGQVRDINSVRYYIMETNKDYLRDAKFEISETLDADSWQELFVVGDGKANGGFDESVAKDADYLTHDSVNPGYMFVGNDDLNLKGRYIKVTITENYTHRWSAFSEIQINKGEYTTQEIFSGIETESIEKPGQLPSYMFDSNLGTSYSLQGETGEFTWTHSNPLDVQRIRLLQTGTREGVTLFATFYDKTRTLSTVELGSLDQALTEFNIPAGKILKSLTVKWTNGAPSISEILSFNNQSPVNKVELQKLVDTKVDKNSWTTSSVRTFEKALKNGNAILENDLVSQVMVNSAIKTLEAAINTAQVKYNGIELQELLDGKISNNPQIYTITSFNKYQVIIKTIEEKVSNIDNVSQVEADALIKDAKASIANLEFSLYQRELAEIRLRSEKRKSYTAEMFTETSFGSYKKVLDNLELAIAEHKQDSSKYEPLDFLKFIKELDEIELVNIQELLTLQEEFAQIDESIYKEELFKVYAQLVQDSLKLNIDGTTDQVKKAVSDIQEAFDALELISNATLDEVITQIDSLDVSKYATDGINALIDRKNEIVAHTDASDAEKEAYAVELEGMIKALVNIEILQERIMFAKEVVSSKDVFTKTSKKALVDAIEKAEETLKTAKTKEEANDAVELINQAIASLVEGVSQELFQTLIAELDAIDVNLYTKNSLQTFVALQESIKTLDYEELSYIEYLEIEQALDAAISKLVTRVSDKAYKAFLESVEVIESSKYTFDSYEKYSVALENIKNIVVEETSLDTFDLLVKQYNEALSNLELIDASDKPISPEKPGDENNEDHSNSQEKENGKQESGKDGKLPTTGSPGSTYILYAGFGALAVGVYLLFKNRSKKDDQ